MKMMINIVGKQAMNELGKLDSLIMLSDKNYEINLGKLFKKMKVVQLQLQLMLLIRKIDVKN